MSDPIQEAIDSGDLSHAVYLLLELVDGLRLRSDGYKDQATDHSKRAGKAESTIAYLREALIESKRETQEARAAAADLEPWLWSDDDTAKTVESMMTVRITGGHLRALIAGAVKADSDAKLKAGCEVMAAGQSAADYARGVGLGRLYETEGDR